MDIALLGGTGDIGKGLALRWAHDTDHTITVGSRHIEKAETKVEEYRRELRERGVDPDIRACDNKTAARDARIVVVSIPPEYVTSTVESIAPSLSDDQVLVSPAVKMERDAAGFHYAAPNGNSIAEEIATVTPDEIPVVGAFQNLAAGALSDLDNDLKADVVLTGDDSEAKWKVESVAEKIDGLRALDGGSLANSALVESITPLLINLAMNNDGLHDLGIRFQ